MQKRIDSNQKADGLLGIRISVWFIVSGLLLTCLLAISISRRWAGPPSVETAPASEHPARRDVPSTPSVRPVHRVPPPGGISEVDMQSTSSQASAAMSNELSAAREKLRELRGNYGEEYPDVKEQVRAIESLERSALTPGETLELAKARAELARLEVRFGPRHQDLQAQRRFVESLEQSAAAGEPSDLAQAKAQLARLRVLYGEGHPDVESQLKKVAELQR